MKCSYMYSCATKWPTCSNYFFGNEIYFTLINISLKCVPNVELSMRPYWFTQWFYRQTRHPASISLQAPSSGLSSTFALSKKYHICPPNAHGFVLFLVSHDKMHSCYVLIYMTTINPKPWIRSREDAGLCLLWIRLLGDNVLFDSTFMPI